MSPKVLKGSLGDVHSKKVRLQSAFLKWAGLNLRSYPWRSLSAGAYDVLIAEILLKRTTAIAAARLYTTFLKKYPSVEHLSVVSEEQLATDLLPVGLHTQRAKALKSLAVHLVEATNGAVPDSLEALLKVPSLGQYSARAILSFGFGQPYAIVDSNVQRILRRVYGSQLDYKTPLKVYQRLADELLPRRRHRQFNLGMLDLGALVCRPVNPKCTECPISYWCDYGSSMEAVG